MSLFPTGWDSSGLVKLLKKEYKRRSQLRPLLWDSTIQLPIEQVYTRLKIVARGKLTIQKKGDDEVNVFEIFRVLDFGEDVMTIVEGSPGIGKTTFCVKLAYDWAHGNIPSECSFPKFEFVFLLKCRDIDGDIMESISEQLLPRDMEMSVEKLWHLMKDIRNQERLMLIILDGLDELPEKSRHHVDELLNRRILAFCYVLATTRQERGIEVRKSGVVFDIHLEIKGYTESDSIAYVRRHFETIDQSPKGEKLIEEMQQNTFLNALRHNPLNLLLLCVVYEDYEGKLPTSRTELYQVIVRCLLRRYCAKRNWSAPEDDSVLEKMFEKEILALGELAWLCLLSDRYGFRETEMDEFERKYPGLVARELGLLYKEESLKRLKPQHEYCFLHKTFQEYMAAAYIAEKLENQQFNVFKHLYISFHDVLTKYPQVFIFVSGMLGEKATVLFTQIGEELKKSYDWNWNERCDEKTATFFIQSFNESGHPEQTAPALCSIIPFPKVITSKLIDNYNASFIQVLRACRSFSNLQIPVELYADIGWERRAIDVVNYLESYPAQLTIVSFRVHDLGSLTSSDAVRLCKWFSASKSLSEFTFKYISYVPPNICEVLVQIGYGLASCRTLTKVTFALPGYAYSEDFFNAFETGLTTLTSVNLVLWGSMKYTATRALQNFLSNKFLNSLSLCIVGGVLDLLVSAVSQALERQTVLKSLDLHLAGPLSSSSANFLEKGLMENSSVNYIRLCVHDELPGNWHSVVENLRLAKKSPVCCSFYPNTFNNVANNNFRPVLVRKGLNVKQHLTVNVWGEMKCEAAEALCEVLAPSSITVLTLNMRGNLTSEVSNSIARCLEENKTLSSLSINLWITDGGNVPSSLSKNSRVQLNVHDVRIGPDESNDVLVTTTDNPAALTVFFTNVKERRKQNVRLTINNDSNVTKEWTRYLGDALAENPSLTTLDLTVNSCVVDADLGENLGNSLLQSSSLTSLSLTFNFSNMNEGWECKLGERLIKMASLTSLSLELNDSSEENQENCLSRTLTLDDGEENQEDCLSPTKLSNVLAAVQSLSSLSIVIHNDCMCSFWDKVVGDCVIKCTSLKKLSLILNGGKLDFNCVFSGLCNGLVRTSSLNTLCVAIFIDDPPYWGFSGMWDSLNQGLSLNSSVTTLTLTVTVADKTGDIGEKINLDHGLSVNTSITTLNVVINECGVGVSLIPGILRACGVFEGLANSTSVTTFNLALNSSQEVSDVWLAGLSYTLKKNTALTTLRLKVSNHCATGKSRLYDFSKLLIESRSLSLIELDVSFYGKESGCHKVLIQ